MSVDNSQSQEDDLDRTDKLPILEGMTVSEDVEDDAVRMEVTALTASIKNDFHRPPRVDLPSLAESVRSVEQRIARQNAEYESLSRSYNKAREAEAAALATSQALVVELAALRSSLETEQTKSRDTDKALKERLAAAEGMRKRIEEAMLEAERAQAESHSLRETLAAREATTAQVLRSLRQRDAQLAALQQEHSRVVPALEERSKAGEQLESDLRAARLHSDAMSADLRQAQDSMAALGVQLRAGERSLEATHHELKIMKSQAASYLEKLQTREWRRGFDQNLFRELDAKIGVAQEGQGLLQAERDELLKRIAEVELMLAARDKSIAKLKASAAADEALHVKRDRELQQIERARAELTGKIATLEGERSQLRDELAAQRASIEKMQAASAAAGSQLAKHVQDLQDLDGERAELTVQIANLESERRRLLAEVATKDRAIEDAVAAGASDAARINGRLTDSERDRAQLVEQIHQFEADAQTREQEMSVLMAQLQEARRPIEAIESEVQRLSGEVAEKTAALEAQNEENQALRLAVERTRGALEEREFLIRRLERSESNNANVLGRIQTSIERLGAPNGAPEMPALASEFFAELARVDGSHNQSFRLARRTRIGRAPGCELQLESSSVSRHHALVLMGQRDVIIEDLNSTNGVLVNGRKISRQLLSDGDMVTIGEAQFRLSLSLDPRVLEADPAS